MTLTRSVPLPRLSSLAVVATCSPSSAARTQLAAAEARYQARAEAIAAEITSLRVTLEAAGLPRRSS